jgi:hypothetical protein
LVLARDQAVRRHHQLLLRLGGPQLLLSASDVTPSSNHAPESVLVGLPKNLHVLIIIFASSCLTP